MKVDKVSTGSSYIDVDIALKSRKANKIVSATNRIGNVSNPSPPNNFSNMAPRLDRAHSVGGDS